jgi:hypothetical protein
MKEKTNEEIIKENRDTLLDRMEASGNYYDQARYPYALMNEASKEIELLRSERDEARIDACYEAWNGQYGKRYTPQAIAEIKGWDCFKKEAKP